MSTKRLHDARGTPEFQNQTYPRCCALFLWRNWPNARSILFDIGPTDPASSVRSNDGSAGVYSDGRTDQKREERQWERGTEMTNWAVGYLFTMIYIATVVTAILVLAIVK